MKTKLLQLSEVVTTAGTQIRASINQDSVAEYAEQMIEGAIFPPVVVFHDGSEYILADGFHRVMAASRNGFKDIEADVRKGTKSDALKYALGANSTHGLKRTNADKRRSVELALTEWPKLSDREIEVICAVSDYLVADVRKSQLPESGSSKQPETRIGRDGKERKLPAKSINKNTGETEAEKEKRIADAFGIKQDAPEQVIEPPAPQPSADSKLLSALGLSNIPADIAAHMESIKEDWDYIKSNPEAELIKDASLNLAVASKMFCRWAKSLE